MRHIFPIIILVFLFEGCGIFIRQPKFRTNPGHEGKLMESNFYYSDGTHNYIRSSIFKESSTIVICVPGLGGDAGTYHNFELFLAQNRVSSVSIDLRGFGHWEKKKGDVENLGLHIGDLDEVVTFFRDRYPDKKIILMGESLGSSMTLWYGSLFPGKIKGIIITSLVTSYGGGEVSFKTVAEWLFYYSVNPGHPFSMDFDPYLYSNDSTFIKGAFKMDTLGVNSISPRYLVQAKRLVKKSYSYLCSSEIPTLLLQGGKDFMSDQKGMNKILKSCNNAHIQYHVYDNCRHSLVNDKNRTAIFHDILQWINGLN